MRKPFRGGWGLWFDLGDVFRRISLFYRYSRREMKTYTTKGNKQLGGMLMDEKELFNLMNELTEYLQREKVFIKNPVRFAEVEQATEIAEKLFSESKISIEDDPIQMGALILRIEGFDILVRGKREIELFQQLIDKADNFEIYAVDEGIRFSILFANALTRLPDGK